MSDKKNKICAVILTGGLSTRMGGGIKSLRNFNNKIISINFSKKNNLLMLKINEINLILYFIKINKNKKTKIISVIYSLRSKKILK